MSAWTIYWILQLDSINSLIAALLIAALAAEIAALGVWLCCHFASPDEWMSQEYKQKAADAQARAPFVRKVLILNTVALVLPLATVSALLPSTRTAAAMVIVPAIANNETIRKESGELYDLAKQALRDAVAGKAKEAAKEAAK